MALSMKRYLPILWVILAMSILAIDYAAGADVILTVLLFFPVALAAWFNGRWWGPVSYTHLDVYKRQV